MFEIEEMETIIAPMSQDATDFWTGFLIGAGITMAILCGGA